MGPGERSLKTGSLTPERPYPPSLTPTEDGQESRAAVRACPSLGGEVC